MMLFDRTFHPDEANQAFTVGHLLETGHYTYRPADHHGPTLYYAAVPLQKVFGHTTTTTLNGTLLRCTPLIFGALTLLFLAQAVHGLVRFFGKRDAMGGGRLIPLLAGGTAALLLGTSPLFVFYATDFIQETLLACFTAVALKCAIGYAVARQPSEDSARPHRLKPGSWALFFGFSVGLCFATKETCSLTFAAAVLAAAPFLFVHLKRKGLRPALGGIVRPNDAVLAVLSFALTAAVLFSSFCQDWAGVYNAFIAAPLSYFHRAAGAASADGANWHIHPWWQYLSWLFLGQPTACPADMAPGLAFAHIHPLLQWSALLLPMGLYAAFGRIRARMPRALVLTFLGASLYFVALVALYSIIPYKTPWCALQILLGFVLAVALGYALFAEVLLDFLRHRRAISFTNGQIAAIRGACLLVPLVFCIGEHLPGLRLVNANPDSRAIPYNYAHASPEVKELAACVDAAIKSAPDPKKAFIAVSLPPEDTWPFPWYNRAWEPQTGYWTKFEDLVELEKTGAKPTVVVVPMKEGHLVQPLFPHLKHTKRFYMRPHVRVRVFW